MAAFGERLIGFGGGDAFLGGEDFGSGMEGGTLDLAEGGVELASLDGDWVVVVLVARGIRILPSWFPNPNKSSNPPLPLAAFGERLIGCSGVGESTAGLCFAVGVGCSDFTTGCELVIVERRILILPVRLF